MATTFAGLRSKYSFLSDELWGQFSSLFERIEVPARTVLLHEGEVARKGYWIEQGCIRVWFSKQGRDTTFQFFFEGQGISSIESFRKGIPSFFTVETVEPCVLYRIHKHHVDEIAAHPAMQAHYNALLADFLFERQLYYMREFLSFIRDSPAERYQRLLQERPHILQRIPQQYIASYLGITSVSLSRIKARFAREKKG